ncbi:hypothetical protein RIF29_25894 [Crotalaria pallida]|uniref:C2H2-type domain-containing protein n=1 Tax=Crotalaria pallida TaxID=3830 RepID=A0AAN9EUE3_CROPI
MVQLSFEADSASSPTSSSSSEDNKGLGYGLRENPKRSFRLSDPEFADTGSVILQDRESETESSRNPTRRRSKRAWKFSLLDHEKQSSKKIKFSIRTNKTESLSSVSDTTTEEDVAFCLMMLSRDKWKRQKELYEEEEEEEDKDEEEEEEDEDEDEDEEESYESEEEMKSTKTITTTTTRVRGKYKCETCNKVFRSYQALGGHRASHKKIKAIVEEQQPQLPNQSINNNNNNNNNNNGAKKIHECPVCFRVFASGQALGGHKRTHVIGSAAAATTATAITIANRTQSVARFGDSFIDLNLPPAPMDDDDVSQIADSAVSDAEFVKSH